MTDIWLSDISGIEVYALIGMGSFFAAVIRAPFTSIIIIFEMTQNYKIVLPLMLANMASYILSWRFSKGSIYEAISEQDGVHLPSNDDSEILESLLVDQAMVSKNIVTLNDDMTVTQAWEKVEEGSVTGFPVLNFGLLSGVISKNEIRSAISLEKGDEKISALSTKSIIHIYPDQSLMVAFHLLDKHKISRLLVVSRFNDRRLLGVLTAQDIVNQFGFHIQEEEKVKNSDTSNLTNPSEVGAVE